MKQSILPLALAAVMGTLAAAAPASSSDDRPRHKMMHGDESDGMRCVHGDEGGDMGPGMGHGMGRMRDMMDKLSPDAQKKVKELKDKMEILHLDHRLAMMKMQMDMMEIVKKDLAK